MTLKIILDTAFLLPTVEEEVRGLDPELLEGLASSS